MSAPGGGPTADPADCAAHAQVSDELRDLVELVAQRLQPWLARMAKPDPVGQAGTSCTWCPVCALISALRGERPELAARLAEHTAGLLAGARELLTPPAGQTPDTDRARRAPSGRVPPRVVPVQHVTVRPASQG